MGSQSSSQSNHPQILVTHYFTNNYHPKQHGIWKSSQGGYMRHFPQSSATNAFLSRSPPNTPLFFNCPICNTKVYQGGLGKICYCECGKPFQLDQNGNLQIPTQTQPSLNQFFLYQSIIPQEKFIPSLVFLDLGVFCQSVPPQFISNNNPQFSLIFNFFLSPFFQKKNRCIGIGQYFQYGDAKFKVVGAYPTYGLVTQDTAIQCSQVLNSHRICKVNVSALKPSKMHVKKFIKQAFKHFQGKNRHIQSEEYLYIGNQQYIVQECYPNDGVVDNQTEFEIQADSLESLTHVLVAPFLEDLSMSVHTLQKAELIEFVFSEYLMPFFQGHRRILDKESVFSVNGVNFTVLDCWPSIGVVTELTAIVYQGSFARQEFSLQNILMSFLNERPSALHNSVSILSQHLQNLERYGPYCQHVSGADQIAISTLPTHQIETIPKNPEQASCMICISEYIVNEQTRTLPCFHMYHVSCIDEWLNRNKMCPVCKTPID